MKTREEMLDYLKKEEGGIVPGFSIKENYILSLALKTKYFEDFDKSELQGLANDLEMSLEEVSEIATEVGGRIYFEFAHIFREDSRK